MRSKKACSCINFSNLKLGATFLSACKSWVTIDCSSFGREFTAVPLISFLNYQIKEKNIELVNILIKFYTLSLVDISGDRLEHGLDVLPLWASPRECIFENDMLDTLFSVSSSKNQENWPEINNYKWSFVNNECFISQVKFAP